MRRVLLMALVLAPAGGCASPVNPSFLVTSSDARAMLREMNEQPQPLERPVVIAAGLLDPGFDVSHIQGVLQKASGQRDRVEAVTFWGLDTGNFDGCRDHLVRRVEQAFGPGEDGQTVEVDVIGFSMGGLVARHAARPRDDGGTRLKIARLFTISTPHRGARMAGAMFTDSRARDMRAGSDFLQQLDAALPDAEYELYPYVRLGDAIVGPENAAPPDRRAWWVPTPAFSFAHLNAATDPRILADIVRRLRGEPPLATEPAAPLDAAAEDKSGIPATAPPREP